MARGLARLQRPGQRSLLAEGSSTPDKWSATRTGQTECWLQRPPRRPCPGTPRHPRARTLPARSRQPPRSQAVQAGRARRIAAAAFRDCSELGERRIVLGLPVTSSLRDASGRPRAPPGAPGRHGAVATVRLPHRIPHRGSTGTGSRRSGLRPTITANDPRPHATPQAYDPMCNSIGTS